MGGGDISTLNELLAAERLKLTNMVPQELLDECKLDNAQSGLDLAKLDAQLAALSNQHAADLASCQSNNHLAGQDLQTCQAALTACENNSNDGQCNPGPMFTAGTLTGAALVTGNLPGALLSASWAYLNAIP